jgi:hypothetical protein
VTIVQTTSANNSNNKTVTATCTGGRKVVGGGFLSNNASVGAQGSYASSATAWTVDAVELSNVPGNWTITAYALCAL